MDPVNKYKLIIVAEDSLAESIAEVRAQLMKDHSLSKSGTSTPQIILARFSQREEFEDRLITRLEMIAQSWPIFHIELKDYGSYPPHTIYLKVAESETVIELVKKIRRNASKLMISGPDAKPGFMSDPHLTIVRKLNAKQFNTGWEEYKDRKFSAKLIAQRMVLVRKRESDSYYMPIKNLDFKNLPPDSVQGLLF